MRRGTYVVDERSCFLFSIRHVSRKFFNLLLNAIRSFTRSQGSIICRLNPTSSRYQVQTRATIMIFPHARLVPTLFRGYVEDRNHWIQQRQFLVETRYSELLYSRQSLLMISPRKPYATEYGYLNRCILACITQVEPAYPSLFQIPSTLEFGYQYPVAYCVFTTVSNTRYQQSDYYNNSALA